MTEADGRFGAEPVSIRRLEDAAGLMRKEERVRVEQAMDRFQRLFPQLFFAVYSGASDGRSDARQFGFWLLNRAAYEDIEIERPNENGILLTIDPEAKAAAIHWGYGLDAFIEEPDTFVVLSRAHAYWVEGRYADGIVRAIEQMSNHLKKRSVQARRDPEKFERKILPPRPANSLLRRIRQGHARRNGKEVHS